MPTYEYACRECGEHLEVQQSFSDPALTECPACHGPLRKVFGNIGISFKGSGFYKTDSRSGNGKSAKKDAAPTEAKEAKEAKSDSTSKSDSASESKAKESKSGSAGTTSAKETSKAAAAS